jgi:hypothetical protein
MIFPTSKLIISFHFFVCVDIVSPCRATSRGSVRKEKLCPSRGDWPESQLKALYQKNPYFEFLHSMKQDNQAYNITFTAVTKRSSLCPTRKSESFPPPSLSDCGSLQKVCLIQWTAVSRLIRVIYGSIPIIKKLG